MCIRSRSHAHHEQMEEVGVKSRYLMNLTPESPRPRHLRDREVAMRNNDVPENQTMVQEAMEH